MSPRTSEEIQMDSLVAQLNLFEAIQASHEIWASKINDPEIEHVHQEIIELMDQLREKYTILLDKQNYHLVEGRND